MLRNISPDSILSGRPCPANLGVRSCTVRKLICPVWSSPTLKKVTCLLGCPSGQKNLENLLWTSCRLVGPNSQWGSKNSAYCTSYGYPKCHSNGTLFSQDKSIGISRTVLILDKIITPPGWISNQAWKRIFWWLIQ